MNKDEHSVCKSCGVPMIDHLGLYGTCEQLLIAQKRIHELETGITKVVCALKKSGVSFSKSLHVLIELVYRETDD